MSQLSYSPLASLDGYIADEDGSFDWAVPDEEVLDHITWQLRAVSTYLYGRRMYELMTVWETDPAAAAQSPGSAEFASVWQRARKVVFSTTLAAASTSNTTLERAFGPERVARIKAEPEGDLTIDGPTIAAHAAGSFTRRSGQAPAEWLPNDSRSDGPPPHQEPRATRP